jgi:hypothetical protein
MNSTPDIQTILTAINTGGLVAALIYGLYLGLSGKVIPVSLLHQIIAQVVEEVLDELEKRAG